jgi:uncharacterized protein YcbK (DUF882 family)
MTPAQLTAKFQRELKEEGIRHFTAKEVFFLGESNTRLKLNAIPPEEIWPRIIATLQFLDTIREQVGRLRLLSIYRNAAYNRAIKGASNSQHVQFRAADVHPFDCSVSTLWRACIEERQNQNFQGGLGRYSTFVHVDCRGSKATW